MSQTIRIFVGTYTQTSSKGIYVYDINSETGIMEYVSHIGDIQNPSFLALSPDGCFLIFCFLLTKMKAKPSFYSINPIYSTIM